MIVHLGARQPIYIALERIEPKGAMTCAQFEVDLRRNIKSVVLLRSIFNFRFQPFPKSEWRRAARNFLSKTRWVTELEIKPE